MEHTPARHNALSPFGQVAAAEDCQDMLQSASEYWNAEIQKGNAHLPNVCILSLSGGVAPFNTRVSSVPALCPWGLRSWRVPNLAQLSKGRE